MASEMIRWWWWNKMHHEYCLTDNHMLPVIFVELHSMLINWTHHKMYTLLVITNWKKVSTSYQSHHSKTIISSLPGIYLVSNNINKMAAICICFQAYILQLWCEIMFHEAFGNNLEIFYAYIRKCLVI